MFKREFLINLKSLIIWLIVAFLFLAIIYIIYPLIINEDNLAMIDQMMTSIDPSILKIFNMDIFTLSHVSGWLYSEGFAMISIFMAIYASILGTTILLKEEDNKTIEYLYSKPISKKRIISSKYFVGIINILLFNTVIFLINLVGLTLSNDLEFSKLLVISSFQLLTIIPIFVISLFLSTLFRKTNNCLMVGIGFVFISYFFNVISLLGEKVSFIKYFSIFTLSNYRNYLIDNVISFGNVVVSIVVIVLFTYLTYYIYDRKEFL